MRESRLYFNPILNADFSDPDIVRDEDRYYMISSTIQMSPGMTLLESPDLVHWKIIGGIIPDVERFHPFMSGRKMGAYHKGVYAGSLRHLKWREKGTLRPRSRWYVYTTIFQAGILVSTADSVYGPWTTQFMKDKNGEELVSPFLKTEEGLSMTAEQLESLEIPGMYWDDNCPYWEFHADGTLKAAYMVASKPGGAWYPHVFRMSLDGMQLLDGELCSMASYGDFARAYSEHGKVVHRDTGREILSSRTMGCREETVLTPQGDIESVVSAQCIPGREGCVIRDIISGEALKVFRFGEDTEIGKQFFNGRHGAQQKISDYIYLFDSEVRQDGRRIPMLHRAKCMYGDRFDENNRYIGPGSPEQPGGFESVPIMMGNADPDDRQPNQGGFVDVPAWLSEDGREHWYFVTHHGDEKAGPNGRPVSLLPVSWVDGWPIPGDSKESGSSDARDWAQGLAGVNSITPVPSGSMVWQCPMPPIKGDFPAVFPQGSDNFGEGAYGGNFNSTQDKLSPIWLWNHAHTERAFSLSERKGWLRLYAVCQQKEEESFFLTPNVLGQRFVDEPVVTVQTCLDPMGLLPGQEAGLVHFNGGRAFVSLAVVRLKNGRLLIRQSEGGEILLSEDCFGLKLKSVVNNGVNSFFYQADEGCEWTPLGDSFRLTPGGFRGDYIGLFTRTCGVPGGFADFDYFQYGWEEKSRANM